MLYEVITINLNLFGASQNKRTTNTMAEQQLTKTDSSEELSFADLFEMEENSKVVAVGDVAIGTVIGEVDDYLLVDVGDKAESYRNNFV